MALSGPWRLLASIAAVLCASPAAVASPASDTHHLGHPRASLSHSPKLGIGTRLASRFRDGPEVQPVTSRAYPWRAFGSIQSDNNSYGSGQLVGPCHVLTAAHVLFEEATPRRRKPGLRYIPYGSKNGYSITRIHSGNYPAGRLSEDWAVATIKRNAGDRKPLGESLGYLGVDRPFDDARIRSEKLTLWLAAYATDIDNGYTLTVQNGVPLLPAKRMRSGYPGIVAHTGGTWKGSSGSALFAMLNGDPRETYVIALNVSSPSIVLDKQSEATFETATLAIAINVFAKEIEEFIRASRCE